MSTNRDADHTIRAWLDLMPDVAPDRAIDAVLQAVDETPQLRRPLVRRPRRFPRMNRLLLVAAVALIGAAMLGGTAALIGAGRPDANPPPSQAPALPSHAPSPAAHLHTPPAPGRGNPAPSRLRSTTWVADVEAMTDLEFGGGPVSISIDETGLHLASSAIGTAGSLAALINLPTERYGFTLEREFAGCPAGTKGYYRVYESDNTTKVEIVALSESCPARAELLSRTWTRSTTELTP